MSSLAVLATSLALASGELMLLLHKKLSKFAVSSLELELVCSLTTDPG